METLNTIFSYIFSIKVWIFISIFYVSLLIAGCIRLKLINDENKMIMECDYSEESILAHIDFIIVEALNYYNIMNIASTQIPYISDRIQQELTDYLVNEVPNRVSPTLMKKLTLMYHPDYVSKFIAERIYMTVMSFVLNYNQGNQNVTASSIIQQNG